MLASRRSLFTTLTLFCASVLAQGYPDAATSTAASSSIGPAQATPVAKPPPLFNGREKILLYSWCNSSDGFPHDSREAAIAAIQKLGQTHGFDVDVNRDSPQAFEAPNYLNSYTALGLISPGGTIFSDAAGINLYQWLTGSAGRVFAVHAASTANARCGDGQQVCGWWPNMMGALFVLHQEVIQHIRFVKQAPHVTTSMFPAAYITPWLDEAYIFDRDPSANGANQLLLTCDDTSYTGEPVQSAQYEGPQHPSAWFREGGDIGGPGGANGTGTYAAGRFFMTALGHPIEAWSDPVYLQHILAALCWVFGRPDDYFGRYIASLNQPLALGSAAPSNIVAIASVPSHSAASVSDAGPLAAAISLLLPALFVVLFN